MRDLGLEVAARQATRLVGSFFPLRASGKGIPDRSQPDRVQP